MPFCHPDVSHRVGYEASRLWVSVGLSTPLECVQLRNLALLWPLEKGSPLGVNQANSRSECRLRIVSETAKGLQVIMVESDIDPA
jgi:hypothetical protein